MDNTGERMVPEFHKHDFIYPEHWGRYFFASQFVKDKRVLDVACGSGYGSNYLAKEGAKKVIGLDCSAEAIDYAKDKFSYKNLEFLVGDAHNLPFKDKSFDVVVGFEMIEHLNDTKRFLSEVKRVIKKGGIILLSTPNEENYPEGNHYHIKEFLEDELKELLSSYFKLNKFFYQKNIASAVILDSDTLSEEESSQPLDITVRKLTSFGTDRSEYFVVVSSDDEKKLNKKVSMEVVLFEEFPIEKYKYLVKSLTNIGERNKQLEETIADIYASRSWMIAKLVRKIFSFRKLLVPSNKI